MKREPWQGKLLPHYEINCADCDATDSIRGGLTAAIARCRQLGWRKIAVRMEPALWRCPTHAAKEIEMGSEVLL